MPGNEIAQSSDTPDRQIRIVFLLTLKGRAVRQVKQLFRMIYRPHHHYFIHIEKVKVFINYSLQ